MKIFLSCDWGTTTFRLRLIDTATNEIVEEEKNSHGINETFKLWKKTGQNEEKRLSFYLDVIREHIVTIEKRTGNTLTEVPLVVSGMASSTIGMIDLPYKQVPFHVDGSDLLTHPITATESFQHDVTIISGVRTGDDVMRGEETKLVGCTNVIADDRTYLFIFPGTHPKHVVVKNNKATSFKTYMTGEFFDLLSKKSILSVSVEEGKGFRESKNIEAFKKGVKDSIQSNILHGCFIVRTNSIFNKLSRPENYYYLSGLLIGSEVSEVINVDYSNITIVGNNAFISHYTTAIEVFGFSGASHFIHTEDADKALIKGQLMMLGTI